MTRVTAAAIGLMVLWACNDRSIQTPTPAPTGNSVVYSQQNINNDLDIVFEIDNSQSMSPEQQRLVANFPVFINVLKSLPAGLPNVHIAVVTSNMGAGAFTPQVDGCKTPDLGTFVDQVRASTNTICATARLNAGAHFIESLGNGTQNNFSGDISDVFSCIAEVGANGCGFESHLESVRAALGDPQGDPAHDIPARTPPANNMGFLRDDAFLAVIFITNEEECSHPPDSVLWDPSQNAVSDPLGPLATRCFSFSDICDGHRVIDYVHMGAAAGPFQSCTSDETDFATDPTKSLIPVQFYIDYFQKRLKANPDKVLVSGVIAPYTPYSLVLDAGTQFPIQGNSCSSSDGVFGQPTPRFQKFFDAFGQNAVQASICDQSYSGAMQRIAELIGRKLGPQCVEGQLADKTTGDKGPLEPPPAGQVLDPSKYDCTVEDVQNIGTPQQKSAGTLQPCNPMGQPSGACFALLGIDSATCSSSVRVLVCRNGFNPSDPMKYCPDGPSVAPDNDTAVIRCATIP